MVNSKRRSCCLKVMRPCGGLVYWQSVSIAQVQPRSSAYFSMTFEKLHLQKLKFGRCSSSRQGIIVVTFSRRYSRCYASDKTACRDPLCQSKSPFSTCERWQSTWSNSSSLQHLKVKRRSPCPLKQSLLTPVHENKKKRRLVNQVRDIICNLPHPLSLSLCSVGVFIFYCNMSRSQHGRHLMQRSWVRQVIHIVVKDWQQTLKYVYQT